MTGPNGTAALDDFSTTGDRNSGSWDANIEFTSSDPITVVTSGAAKAKQNTVRSESYWAAATFSSPCEVWALFDQSNRELVYLFYCLDDPAGEVGNTSQRDGYRLRWDYSSGNDSLFLDRMDNGVLTQLGATITRNMSDGDAFGADVQSGTHTIWYRASGGSWTSLTTRSDSTYTTGFLGIIIDEQSLSTDLSISEFGGGSLSAGPLTLNVGDTSTLSDAIAKGIGKTVADTSTQVDSYGRVVDFNRTFGDTLTGADALVKALGISKADALALSDSLAVVAAFQRAFGDTTTTIDALARTVAYARSLSDSSALTDDLARTVAYARTWADSITSDDALIKVIGKALADSSALSDALTTTIPGAYDDTFTDTDGVDLEDHVGENVTWEKYGTGLMEIQDNALRAATAFDGATYYNPEPTSFQEGVVEAKFTYLGSESNVQVLRILIGVHDASGDIRWHGFGWNGFSGALAISRSMSGTGDLITTSWTPVVDQTYTFRIEVEGSIVRGYVDGVEVLEYDDEFFVFTGKPGVNYYSSNAVDAGWLLDDYIINPGVVPPLTLDLADTITQSDAITRTLQRVFADEAALTDAIQKVVGSTLTDASSMTDALTKGFHMSRSDQIALADALAKNIGMAFADEVQLTDDALIQLQGIASAILLTRMMMGYGG